MKKESVPLLISLILVEGTPTPSHPHIALVYPHLETLLERDLPPSPPLQSFTQPAGKRGLWLCVYCGILGYLRTYMSSSIKHL